MSTYATYSVLDLLDRFSSSEPIPAGGSAAALTGAVGAALLLMVASIGKSRTGTPEEGASLARATSQIRPLRDTLVDLIDRDSAAYQAVLAAFRLPRNNEAEEARRLEAVDAAMHGATDVPLDTMRACRQALALARTVADAGYRVAASDVYVGTELLLAALRGAARNVDENTGHLRDAEYTARVRTERRRLEDEAAADAASARSSLAR
ncbi:MAG TPA: cyclodeaminase/cyclohydrolase family protein [Vicinamibacterales bacterium]|nr:cyclodeaminase/cyclohydrolase family protein [Vicinamibacterales bacterium]